MRNRVRLTNSLLLCILGTGALTLIAYLKGTDTSMAVATIIGAYIARRGAEGVAAVNAASKDPNADTLAAIREVQEQDTK